MEREKITAGHIGSRKIEDWSVGSATVLWHTDAGSSTLVDAVNQEGGENRVSGDGSDHRQSGNQRKDAHDESSKGCSGVEDFSGLSLGKGSLQGISSKERTLQRLEYSEMTGINQ